MASYDLSKIKDENGNEYNIKAKALESQIQIALSGDVSGSQTTDFSEDATISTTIETGAVTESKLATDSVSTNKVKDGNITLAKIAGSAYSGAVSDNDTNLATHKQVKDYVDAVVSGEGKYKGTQSVATINSWTADDLNNGDRVITTDAGTITLGNLTVEAAQELVFWKDGSTAIWQTSEGNYKLKQTAKSDPTASGDTTEFIDTITQNENGDITATKKAITSIGITGGTGIDVTENSNGVTINNTLKHNNITATNGVINNLCNCSTTAATAPKVASITSGAIQLSEGLEVNVYFENTNTASSPTLNINSTGAKPIYYNDEQITNSAPAIGLLSGVCKFVYSTSILSTGAWCLVGGGSAISATYNSSENSLTFNGLSFT